MTLFTDNPFEKMMIQKPDYGKREKSPPELSSPRCAGCPYKGQSPCVGYCMRNGKLLKPSLKKPERKSRRSCFLKQSVLCRKKSAKPYCCIISRE